MNENNYFIQFEYARSKHSIHFLSHNDFSKGNFIDKAVMAETIEDFIRSNNLRKKDAKVTNACLFGKGGELIAKVSDFGQESNI